MLEMRFGTAPSLVSGSALLGVDDSFGPHHNVEEFRGDCFLAQRALRLTQIVQLVGNITRGRGHDIETHTVFLCQSFDERAANLEQKILCGKLREQFLDLELVERRRGGSRPECRQLDR